MKKILLFLILIIAFSPKIYSQDDVKKTAVEAINNATKKTATIVEDTTKLKRWYIKNNITFNTEQNAFSNWEAGGVGSFAFSVFYNGFFNYHRQKLKWDNSLELGYGKMRQDNNGRGVFDKGNKFRKNEDKIEFNSILGYRAFRSWNYSLLVNFKSQFDNGYKDDSILVSALLSPAYLTTSIGFEYKPKPFISILISPLTGRTTFIYKESLAKAGNYSMEEDGQRTFFAVGSYIKLFFEKEVFTNGHLLAKLEFFNDYNKTPFLTNTDINFEANLTMKVNKYLSAFINIQVAYNYDFSSKIQFKERIGVSIPLSF
ncbi:MAG: DUF3078 domain-containing protein [Bacteroidales bacterium]|jgi:hypothetical protein|nr:DUF3078 domain-containing protein [Bacteroidales bacterium]